MVTPNKAVSKAKANEPGVKIPEGARRPADHASAKEDVEGPKDVTFEYKGHEYTVDGAAMDDAELMEHFTTNNFVGALMLLLGNKQWLAWKGRARNEDTGRVPATAAAEFLEFVLKEVKRKNS